MPASCDQACFAANHHLQRTADALHLRVNSLRYRLARIRELAGVDLHDPDDRFLLELAVPVHDLLDVQAP